MMAPLSTKHSLLWVTDPWDTLAHNQDTTIRLMQEAVALGIPTYWSSSNLILSQPNHLLASPYQGEIKIDSPPKNWQPFEPTSFQQIHYRVDPPVDLNFTSLIDALIARGVREDQIINPPAILKYQSEKTPPAELNAFCAKFWVIRDLDSAKKIITELDPTQKTWVIKPMNQAQSKGVKLISACTNEVEWMKTFKEITHAFSEPMLIQEYLSGIQNGEVRLWFANGNFIASLKKFPKPGDFRVLIDEGSRIEAYELNADEYKIALAIGKVLKKQRVGLAAIDLIDQKISDYNITSPGLLVQMEQVNQGKNFAREIILALIS